MPSLEDLDAFKEIINSLGNEEEILQSRGETIEDIPHPDEGLPDDLSDLLADTSDLGDDSAGVTSDIEEPFDEFDIDSLLDEAPVEEAEIPPAEEPPIDTGEPDTETSADEEFDDLDLDALIEETAPGRRDDRAPAPPPPDTTEAAEPSEPSTDDEFFLDIDSDLGELDALGESSGGGEPETGGLDEFDLGEFEAEEPEAEEPEAEPEAGMEPGGDEAEAEEAPETDVFGTEIFEEPVQQEGPGGEEEFDLGGLDEFDLGEFEAEEPEAEPEAGMAPGGDEAAEEAPETDVFGTEAFEEPVQQEGPGGEEEFDLGGLDEFDLGEFEAEEPEAEPEAGMEPGGDDAEAEEALETDVFGTEIFEEPVQQEGPGGEEEFDLGGLDEFDLGEFEAEEPEAEPEAGMAPGGDEAEAEETPETDVFGTEIFEEESFGEQAPQETEGGVEDIEDEFGIDLNESFEQSDQFPFEEETSGETGRDDGFSDFEFPDTEVPTADEFEIPEDGELSEDDFEVDQFNLDGITEEFGLEEGTEFDESDISAAGTTETLEEAEETFDISDADFINIKRTLGELPRNLKMIIEELIGEKGLGGDDLKKLVDMLAAGESAKAIANVTGKITGKKIKIPEKYEKKTGAEFEEERQSFSYIFRTKVFPFVKIAFAVILILGFFGYMGYRFIYKPLHAQSLYKKGYEELMQDEYTPANEYFDAAFAVKPKIDWFYKYAEGFIGKKQYFLAEKKYEQLIRHYPDDEKGLLDYAHLESGILSNYQKAEGLLKQILDRDMYNYDALLAAGDNYLAWANEDPSKYERARYSYAELLQHYGGSDELLFRMLRYFIRTDNYKEVVRLKNQFQSNSKVQINPQIYAELGGYLISKKQLEDVKDILFRAMQIDRSIPEIHYNLARYFSQLQDYSEEYKALNNAVKYFDESAPLSPARLGMLIDTYDRIGEYHYRRKEYLNAEQSYQKGIKLYEDARERKLLGPSAKFGKLYSNLGDVYYYISGNLDTAYSLYRKAERNLYTTHGISYKEGFILYGKGKYTDSLLEFYKAAGDFSENKNLMFATANNLFERKEYFAAQGYYNHLLDILEKELSNIEYLLINERDDHRSLVEYLMKVYNNLGVTLYKLSEKSSDPTKYSTALAYLTKSSDYSDMLTRNPDTLMRSQAMNLSYLNTRSIIYPLAKNEPQIYTNIPQDLTDLLF